MVLSWLKVRKMKQQRRRHNKEQESFPGVDSGTVSSDRTKAEASTVSFLSYETDTAPSRSVVVGGVGGGGRDDGGSGQDAFQMRSTGSLVAAPTRSAAAAACELVAQNEELLHATQLDDIQDSPEHNDMELDLSRAELDNFIAARASAAEAAELAAAARAASPATVRATTPLNNGGGGVGGGSNNNITTTNTLLTVLGRAPSAVEEYSPFHRLTSSLSATSSSIFLSPTGSVSASSFDGSSSDTTLPAGNVTINPSTLLLTGVVCLSVLDPRHRDAEGRSQRGDRLNAPASERIVRDSLKRHMVFHLAADRANNRFLPTKQQQQQQHQTRDPNSQQGEGRHDDDDDNDDDDDDIFDPTTSTGMSFLESDDDSSGGESSPDDELSARRKERRRRREQEQQQHVDTDFIRNNQSNGGGSRVCQYAHLMARNYLHRNCITAAMDIYQALLETQYQDVFVYADQQRADTLSKLAVLCLLSGCSCRRGSSERARCKGLQERALQYSTEALALHADAGRPLHAAVSAMEMGLVCYAAHKPGQALKSWRQAMHMTCISMGYDHPHVAVLLNNIGVLHWSQGDAVGSRRALEESLQLQRNLLRSMCPAVMAASHGAAGMVAPVDYALHQLAATMGNLAAACELSAEYDAAVGWLQETAALYESVGGPAAPRMQEAVSNSADRILAEQERRDKERDRQERERQQAAEDARSAARAEARIKTEAAATGTGKGTSPSNAAKKSPRRHPLHRSHQELNRHHQQARPRSLPPPQLVSTSSSSSSTSSPKAIIKIDKSSTKLLGGDASSLTDDLSSLTMWLDEQMEKERENCTDDKGVGDSAHPGSVAKGSADSLLESSSEADLSGCEGSGNYLINRDLILLGSLAKQLSPEERVQETVMEWFGRGGSNQEEQQQGRQRQQRKGAGNNGKEDGGGGSSGSRSRSPFVDYLTQDSMSSITGSGCGTESESRSPEQRRRRRRGVRSAPAPPQHRRELLDAAARHLQSVHARASEHLDQNRIGKAIELFDTVITRHRRELGDDFDPFLVGNALHNMGMVLLLARDYDRAREAFAEAIAVRDCSGGNDAAAALDTIVSSSYIKLGLIHLATGDAAAASDTFWDLREKMVHAGAGHRHPSYAVIINNIGVAQYMQGELQHAQRSFEVAYDYQRQRLDDGSREQHGGLLSPAAAGNAKLDMASSLSNIAFVVARQEGRSSGDALRLYQRAELIFKRFLEPSNPRLTTIQGNIKFLMVRSSDHGSVANRYCRGVGTWDDGGTRGGDGSGASRSTTRTGATSRRSCQDAAHDVVYSTTHPMCLFDLF